MEALENWKCLCFPKNLLIYLMEISQSALKVWHIMRWEIGPKELYTQIVREINASGKLQASENFFMADRAEGSPGGGWRRRQNNSIFIIRRALEGNFHVILNRGDRNFPA